LLHAPDNLIAHHLRDMFHRVLDEAGDNDPPHPTGEAIAEYDLMYDEYRLVVPFRMPDGGVRDYGTSIHRESFYRTYSLGPPSGRQRYAIGDLWSRVYEDHYMRRMERAARSAINTAPDLQTYEMRQRAWLEVRDHALNAHAVPSPFIMRDEDLGPETATQVRHRQEIVDRHVRSMSRRVDEHLMQAMFGTVSSNVEPAPSGEPTNYETVLQSLQRLADFRQNNRWIDHWRDAFINGQTRIAADWGSFSEDLALYGSAAMFVEAPEVGTKEAQARGLQLLKENLTPEQLASYEKNKHFDVKGGETGKTYRIRHGRQMNITELDAKGNRACGWCFLPQGALVSGDCMLAQKTALELFETEALGIANRFA
jgi:hypothetical protein